MFFLNYFISHNLSCPVMVGIMSRSLEKPCLAIWVESLH